MTVQNVLLYVFFPNNGTLKGSSGLKIKDPYDALPGSWQPAAQLRPPHPIAVKMHT